MIRCSQLFVAALAVMVLPLDAAGFIDGSGMTPELREQIVKKHNQLRVKEGAADMTLLKWEYALEETSTKWADKCSFTHSLKEWQDYAGDCAGNLCGQFQGENIFMDAKKNIDVDDAVQEWYDEKADYTFGDGRFRPENCAPGKTCEHYTQVISRRSLMVGCAFKRCEGGKYDSYLVCQYHPVGNVAGKILMTKGKPCTSCAIGFDCCEDFECTGKYPPDVATGTYQWDLDCKGNIEEFALGTCMKAPKGGDWGSHIAKIVPNWRKWGLIINVFSDEECKDFKFDTPVQDLNTCTDTVGFSNNIKYKEADKLMSPPGDLESQAVGTCEGEKESLTGVRATVGARMEAAKHNTFVNSTFSAMRPPRPTGLLKWQDPQTQKKLVGKSVERHGLKVRALLQMEQSLPGTCDLVEEDVAE